MPTVAEVIEKLQTYNPEALVEVYDTHKNRQRELSDIQLMFDKVVFYPTT